MNNVPEPVICDICKKVHPDSASGKCDVWCKEQTEKTTETKEVKDT